MSYWVLLDDWIEIKISGPQTIEYLNGIITKDLNHIEEGEVVRAGFLTPNAKVRSIFWLIKKEEAVFFYCPSHMKDNLVQDLLKYKLSMDVKLEDISDETPNLYLVPSDKKIPGLSGDQIGLTFLHSDDEPDGVELHYDDFTSLLVSEGITPTEVMIGENPYELGIDDIITLEKGCFLGQEPISRMYHRGNPRKYIFQIEVPDNDIGEEIYQGDEEIGKVLIQSEDKALAFIRRTIDDLSNLVIGNEPVEVIKRVGSYPSNDRN